MTRRQSNPIVWINLNPRNTSTTSSFKIDPHTAEMEDNAGNKRSPMNVFVYAPYKVNAERKINNANAQPVDWAFKSDTKHQKGILLRARGLFARIASRGLQLAEMASFTPIGPGVFTIYFWVLTGSLIALRLLT